MGLPLKKIVATFLILVFGGRNFTTPVYAAILENNVYGESYLANGETIAHNIGEEKAKLYSRYQSLVDPTQQKTFQGVLNQFLLRDARIKESCESSEKLIRQQDSSLKSVLAQGLENKRPLGKEKIIAALYAVTVIATVAMYRYALGLLSHTLKTNNTGITYWISGTIITVFAAAILGAFGYKAWDSLSFIGKNINRNSLGTDPEAFLKPSFENISQQLCELKQQAENEMKDTLDLFDLSLQKEGINIPRSSLLIPEVTIAAKLPEGVTPPTQVVKTPGEIQVEKPAVVVNTSPVSAPVPSQKETKISLASQVTTPEKLPEGVTAPEVIITDENSEKVIAVEKNPTAKNDQTALQAGEDKGAADSVTILEEDSSESDQKTSGEENPPPRG